jgi:hypothetical protein
MSVEHRGLIRCFSWDFIMRSLLLILLWATGSLQTLAANRVTTAQLENVVSAARHKSDAQAARQISGLELTERLNTSRLSSCVASLPGPHAKEALLAIADMSAFLDPPTSEVPNLAEPDPAAQREVVTLAVHYASMTMHNLPNLFAARVTTTFKQDLGSRKPLHPVGRFRARVLYRDGDEREQPIGRGGMEKGLTTSGEFGPILGTALLDAAQGNLTWSHWEQSADGPAAVFTYAVNAKQSHYKVENRTTAYQGEIAIDPSNGTILRIALRSDPATDNSLSRAADIVVEYGPVELGGKRYICPLKGVALSQGWQDSWLNDVVFEQYHLLRSNMRILPDFSPIQ